MTRPDPEQIRAYQTGIGYLPALEGLRAVSILLVFVSHANLGHIVPGGLGVTLFFFISGYIITRLMLAEHAKQGKLDISAFYTRRFFRLMPALYVFMAVASVVLVLAGQGVAPADLASVAFYYSNYWSIYGMFQVGTLGSPFPITWSLAIENHYYLVYPLLFAALVARPGRLLAVLTALLVVVLAWRLWLALGVGMAALPADRIYMGTDTRVDSILYGAAFAMLGTLRPDWIRAFGHWAWFAAGLLLLGFTLGFRDDVFRETWRYSLQGIAIACMFQALVFERNVFQRVLSAPLLVYIGKISYSLYLYHWLVHEMLDAWLPGLGVLPHLALMTVFSFAAAHLSYRWIERSGLAWRDRLLGPRNRPEQAPSKKESA